MSNQMVEEEYIDMEINSTTTTTNYSSSPPQASREFEFHMSSNDLHSLLTPSPADDLFFNGHLLPLQLLKTTTTTTTTTNTTPFESCNISPVTSCFPSGELNPDDYFFECSKEFSVEDSSFQTKTSSNNNKSWSKKLKLIKKASKAYLKSLFTKSSCSDTKECSSGNLKSMKKTPFGHIQKAASLIKRVEGEKKKMVGEDCKHRRSFSGAIKRRASGSGSSSSSSSSSSCSSSNSSSFSSENSNGPCQMLKRSSSVSSDNECSIQGAIAYCKKTQQQVKGRKSVSDVQFYLMSESRVDV